jgi:hypothetical protein
MRKSAKRTNTKKLISPLGKWPRPPYRHLDEAAQAIITATTEAATKKMTTEAHPLNVHAGEKDSSSVLLPLHQPMN